MQVKFRSFRVIVSGLYWIYFVKVHKIIYMVVPNYIPKKIDIFILFHDQFPLKNYMYCAKQTMQRDRIKNEHHKN